MAEPVTLAFGLLESAGSALDAHGLGELEQRDVVADLEGKDARHGVDALLGYTQLELLTAAPDLSRGDRCSRAASSSWVYIDMILRDPISLRARRGRAATRGRTRGSRRSEGAGRTGEPPGRAPAVCVASASFSSPSPPLARHADASCRVAVVLAGNSMRFLVMARQGQMSQGCRSGSAPPTHLRTTSGLQWRGPGPELENGDRGGWPPFSKHRCLGRGGCPRNCATHVT